MSQALLYMPIWTDSYWRVTAMGPGFSANAFCKLCGCEYRIHHKSDCWIELPSDNKIEDYVDLCNLYNTLDQL